MCGDEVVVLVADGQIPCGCGVAGVPVDAFDADERVVWCL